MPAENRQRQSTDGADGIAEFVKNLREIDVNSYATRKSIAFGLLDLALITANVTQLKYITAVGSDHENFYLMLILICVSMVLQVLQALLIVVLAVVYDLNKLEQQRRADVINSILVGITVITVVVNIVINVFDYRDTNDRIG